MNKVKNQLQQSKPSRYSGLLSPNPEGLTDQQEKQTLLANGELNLKTKQKKAHLHFSVCPSWNFNDHVTNCFLKDLVSKNKNAF